MYIKRIILYCILPCLLAVMTGACGGASTRRAQQDSTRTHAQAASLSEQVLAIAEALPIPAAGADTFFSRLAGSLQVSNDQHYKIFSASTCRFNVDTSGPEISRVDISPVNDRQLQLPLNEMAARMDSAWHDPPPGPIPVKEPPHIVQAFYTDGQQRKKLVSVAGLEAAMLSPREKMYTTGYIVISMANEKTGPF